MSAGDPDNVVSSADGNPTTGDGESPDAQVGSPDRPTSDVGQRTSVDTVDPSPATDPTSTDDAVDPDPTRVEPADAGDPPPKAAADGRADGVTDAVDADADADPEPAGDDADGAAPTGRKKKKKEKRPGSFWRELPVLLVIALALAMLIKTFLVQAFFIPSASMEKTLHGCTGCSGDRVLVNKFIYHFRDPKPGEVVVFKAPQWQSEVEVSDPGNIVQRALRSVGQAIGVAQPSEKEFIKRVIAVGGQEVRCCDEQGRILVDNVPLDEPYVFDEGTPPQKFGPITVPEGRMWMMGDHRNESADSRAHQSDSNQGTIAVDDVIGKAFVIAWPPSRWDGLGRPDTFDNIDASAATTGPDGEGTVRAATGPQANAVPFGLGLLGALPIVALRRRRRRRRR